MTGPQLVVYDRRDVSSITSPSVLGTRNVSPAGCLIHTTGGTSSRSWLQGGSALAGTPSSSDALIDRDGTQWLLTPDGRCAYHAGASRVILDRVYHDYELNELLIGIELECLDGQQPTFAQYDSLADLQIFFSFRYKWRWPLITFGHYAVAMPLGRRSDPVGFDWGTWLGRIYYRSAQMRLPGL